MTLGPVHAVPVERKRKEAEVVVEAEVEDTRASVKNKKAASVQEAEAASKPGMAAACLAEFSRPQFVVMGEYSRSTSLSRSGAERQDGEVSGEFHEVREEDRAEEGASVPSVPDSWAGDAFLHAGDAWESGSVSVVPMPILSNRDRLQRHRLQVAGHVSIPDTWPGEQHLLDWIDTEEVEEGLRPLGLMMARAALINEQSKGSGSRRLR